MLKTIPLTAIHPATDNPRGAIDPASLTALAASIREIGLISPIAVIPEPGEAGMFRVIAGSRRFEAAHLAGNILAIPALVLDEVPAGLALAENMQRADLTPIEEGEAIRKLLDQGRTAREIAAHLGRSVGFALRRAKLTAIIDGIRELAEEDKWTTEMLEIIAAYSPDVQERLLKSYSLNGCDNREDLIKAITSETHQIANSPWGPENATLVPEAGACCSCPKRTGVSPDLFGDLDARISQQDRCLDEECWKRKGAALVELRKAESPAGTLSIAMNYGHCDNREALRPHEFTVVEEGTPEALPAIVEAGCPDAGKVIHVIPRARPKTRPEEGAQAPQEEKRVSVQERREILESRRRSYVLKRMAQEIRDAEELTPHFLQAVALVAVFGTWENAIPTHHKQQDPSPWKSAKSAAQQGEENMAIHLWGRVKEVLARRFEILASGSSPSGDMAEAKDACQFLGLNWRGYLAAAHEAIPTPPDLQDETPPKGAKKGAKK